MDQEAQEIALTGQVLQSDDGWRRGHQQEHGNGNMEKHHACLDLQGSPITRRTVSDWLCLHDFRFQAGGKGHDFTALWLGHFKRIKRIR